VEAIAASGALAYHTWRDHDQLLQRLGDLRQHGRANPWLIFIKSGIYTELVRIPNNKPFIHFIGQDKDKVKII
jgi:pectin methylesterase-like acyl-CoA thioesterase